jgi:hypothetical protein
MSEGLKPEVVGLEDLLRVARGAVSAKLVDEVIRTAYALGKFDGVIESVRTNIEAQQRLCSLQKLS